MLAPLEGVADTVFRRIVASTAKPDLFVTEFTSADGFCSPGKPYVAENFLYTKEEEPIIAQLWGKNPKTMYETAKAVAGMGFAGIDINMGCPDKNVMHNGCGAAMIDTPDVAGSMIQAVKDGIKDSGVDLPISVKTRLGNKTIVRDAWITYLLEQKLDALTIHGRTAKELSKVPAHWDEIGQVVKMRNTMGIPTVIIGNGDVIDAKDAREKHEKYGVDGVMIGRGIFANPWCFDTSASPHVGTVAEHLALMEKHVRLFDEVWHGRKNYPILKKFYKIYVKGFEGATEWRMKFMETDSASEALGLLKELEQSLRITT